jgi:hypothetical protein
MFIIKNLVREQDEIGNCFFLLSFVRDNCFLFRWDNEIQNLLLKQTLLKKIVWYLTMLIVLMIVFNHWIKQIQFKGWDLIFLSIEEYGFYNIGHGHFRYS